MVILLDIFASHPYLWHPKELISSFPCNENIVLQHQDVQGFAC